METSSKTAADLETYSLPLVPLSPNRCFWPWSHQWERWKVIEEGKVGATGEISGKHVIVGHYEIQRRECKLCGKSQLRQTQS